jgi:hypothetical protein
MNSDLYCIPMATIHPDKICLYNKIEFDGTRPRRNPSVHLQGVNNSHAGKVSVVARRKISKAVRYLLFLANDKYLPDTAHGKAYKFRLGFLTLTLPSSQIHTDQEIKEKCLNQLFIEMRRKWNVHNYIWRAEKQKNGNIHFHILVDKFVPWSELRDCWNRIVNKLGYVDRYRDEMRAFHSGSFTVRRDLLKTWTYKAQVKAYQKGKANDWSSPNSTDVHSVHTVKNIQAYIVKYCTKDEQSADLKGRLWGCNQELSNLKGCQLVVDNSFQSAIDELILSKNPEVYNGEYFSVIYASPQQLSELSNKDLFNAFGAYLIEHFGFNIQSTFPT